MITEKFLLLNQGNNILIKDKNEKIATFNVIKIYGVNMIAIIMIAVAIFLFLSIYNK